MGLSITMDRQRFFYLALTLISTLLIMASYFSRPANAATTSTTDLLDINPPTQVYTATATSLTIRCLVQPNTDAGQYMATYKLPTDSLFSLTSVKTNYAAGPDFQANITITGLTPDTDYSVRCRVRANNTTVNGTRVITARTLPGAPAAGMTVSKTSLAVSEPSTTDNFSVVLTSQPTANVVVSAASTDTTEGTVSPSSVTFTSSNWNVPQTVTLSAVDDTVVDGTVNYSVTLATASSDPAYNQLTLAPVAAATADNDTPPTYDVTMAVVGDICKDDGTGDSCRDTANLAAALNPTYAVPLGDTQYADGTTAQFMANYDKAWGRGTGSATLPNGKKLYEVSLPVIGNHEITKLASGVETADGYCNYFADLVTVSPLNVNVNCGATDASKFSYYEDLPNSNWRFISFETTGGTTTAQRSLLTQWLQNAKNNNRNVVLAFHQPLNSTYCNGCHYVDGFATNMQSLWSVAVNNGADLVLNGHDHKYERFLPVAANGLTTDTANGLVAILNGMGASSYGSIENDYGCYGDKFVIDPATNQKISASCIGDIDKGFPANETHQNGNTYNMNRYGGVLKLTLKSNQAEAVFIEANGGLGTVRDSVVVPVRN